MRSLTGKLKIAIPLVVVGLSVAVGLLVFAQRRSGPAQTRPRRTASVSSGENVLRTGDDLQQAVNKARFGDTILLEAGATFTGPIILVDKGTGTGTDADYITIRTANLADIPPDGERIKPSAKLPRIVAPNSSASVSTREKAHHYKFIGVEFAPAANADYVYNLIDLGASDYNSMSQLPHHLVFDRCYVHSTGLNKARRGFALNSGDTTIINSHVSGFAGAGDETQAIAGWNGSGPFHIINNYLEGGGEVVLFGGSDPSIQGLVPSDIELRRNFLHKPADWAGRATIKGTFELKNAKRVIVEGNVIDTGIRVNAFAITVRNQNGGAPWSTIEDIQIVSNIVRNASTGVNILGTDDLKPSQEAKRISIVNNVFQDLASPGDNAYFVQTNGADSVTVSHNTVQQAGNIVTSYGTPTKNFSFINNIVQYNSYGISCQVQGAPCSDSAFCLCFPKATIKGNVIADNLNVSASTPIQNNFPLGNFFVGSYAQIGFVDYAAGNWTLSAASKIRKRATDGKDPGVDFDLLNASGVFSAADGRKL
jgi:hypothetical protein